MDFRGPSSRAAWTRGTAPDTTNALEAADAVGDLLADDTVAAALREHASAGGAGAAGAGATASAPSYGPWSAYAMDDMQLRSNAGVPIPQWASMGYWRKQQFGLLYALSIRCREPACRVQTLHRAVLAADGVAVRAWQFVLVLDLEAQGRTVAVAVAPSKSKAKQAVAADAIARAQLGGWLAQHHTDTPCEAHVQHASPAHRLPS